MRSKISSKLIFVIGYIYCIQAVSWLGASGAEEKSGIIHLYRSITSMVEVDLSVQRGQAVPQQNQDTYFLAERGPIERSPSLEKIGPLSLEVTVRFA